MPSRFTRLTALLLALSLLAPGCASDKTSSSSSPRSSVEPDQTSQPRIDQQVATTNPPSKSEPSLPSTDSDSKVDEASPAETSPREPRYADIDWPHLKVDLNNRVVEIEGFSGINKGWLEQIICLTGTRTHESVLITEAKPSHIHAALLLIGLEPGRPGWWKIDPDDPKGQKWIVEPPKGAAVSITVQWTDKQEQQHEVPIRQWVRDFHSHDLLPEGPWIFGGSTMRADYTGEVGYLADRTGSIAGLVTFGDELLGWCEVLPDQEAVMAPEWEAHTEAMPEPFSPVTIRLRPASTKQ